MKKGAFALVDVLGFKGIWQRHEASAVLATLEEFQRRMRDDLAQIAKQPDFQFEAAFISDTLALALSQSEDYGGQGAGPGLSVAYTADILTRLLAWSARCNTPLAFRGAITYGEYAMSSNFIIGPAVDSAAAAHELAEGAIIWLMPEAKDAVDRWLAIWRERNPNVEAGAAPFRATNTHLVQHAVPLKKREHPLATHTVSPLLQAAGVEDAIALAKALLATFDVSVPGVAAKRENTRRHLVDCFAWRGFSTDGLEHL